MEEDFKVSAEKSSSLQLNNVSLLLSNSVVTSVRTVKVQHPTMSDTVFFYCTDERIVSIFILVIFLKFQTVPLIWYRIKWSFFRTTSWKLLMASSESTFSIFETVTTIHLQAGPPHNSYWGLFCWAGDPCTVPAAVNHHSHKIVHAIQVNCIPGRVEQTELEGEHHSIGELGVAVQLLHVLEPLQV